VPASAAAHPVTVPELPVAAAADGDADGEAPGVGDVSTADVSGEGVAADGVALADGDELPEASDDFPDAPPASPALPPESCEPLGALSV
jgi:hypothetical protein